MEARRVDLRDLSKSIEKEKKHDRSVDNLLVTASVFMCKKSSLLFPHALALEVHYHSMKNTSTKIGLWLIKKNKPKNITLC